MIGFRTIQFCIGTKRKATKRKADTGFRTI